MICARCKEEFSGKPIRQANEYYCSLECANAAAGTPSDEEEAYFEESDLEGLYEEGEEEE